MISILSSPKTFSGVFSDIQINAIKSWLALGNDVQVILYGNSLGIESVTEELGVLHVPGIESNGNGIPYFGAIAGHAAEHARYDFQVYLNCDILLTPHILGVIKRIPFTHFLMVGQRIDLSEGVEVDTTDPELINRLNTLAQVDRITLHPPAGSDYFAFRRGMWSDLPPVIIGRGGYDNALIAYCLQRHIPVIDSTLAIPALHQFHDYSHVDNGVNEVFGGLDAKRNLALCAGQNGLSLLDATWMIKGRTLERSRCRGDWSRAIETSLRVAHKQRTLADIFFLIRRLVHRLNYSSDWQVTLADQLASFEM